jgi:hypothetical protein
VNTINKKSKKEKEKTLKVTPKNKPEIINYHFEIKNGKKIKVPGIPNISLVINENIDDTIENIFKQPISLINIKQMKVLYKNLQNCKYKLYAVKYHLEIIKKEIKDQIDSFMKDYRASSGASIESVNPILIYETEAFLFQVKSNLDLIVQVLGSIITPIRSFCTFKHKGKRGTSTYQAGGKVIDKLKEIEELELAELFDKQRIDWIQQMTIWRDTITHYSGLRNFHCFIEEPYLGGDQVNIHYPTIPSGERVDIYCQKIYNSLCKLYKEVFNLIDKHIL